MKKKFWAALSLGVIGFTLLSCADFNKPELMRKDGGYNIVTIGEYNDFYHPIVVNNYEQITLKLSEAIAKGYTDIYFKFAISNLRNKKVERLFYISEIDGHVDNLVIYIYDENHEELDVEVNDPIENGWIVRFNMAYGPITVASHHTQRTIKNTTYKRINGNMILRSLSYEKRDDDFENFPLKLDHVGTMSVRNSEELWWACENHYWPVFENPSSRAAAIFELAKDICRTYISDEMNDFQKALTIYDYITSNISYDYDCLDDSVSWRKTVAYFLEGPFAYSNGVCDSFSKMFCLLGGLEGLDVIRSFGYKFEGGGIASGHAWNYVSLDNRESWYLCCPTWGRYEKKITDSREPSPVFLTAYDAAFTSSTYFHDVGGIDFTEMIWDDYNKNTIHLDIGERDIFIHNDITYNYKPESLEQLEMMVDIILSQGVNNEFYLSLENSATIDWFNILSSPKGPREHTIKKQFKQYLQTKGYESYYFFGGNKNAYNMGCFTILIS